MGIRIKKCLGYGLTNASEILDVDLDKFSNKCYDLSTYDFLSSIDKIPPRRFGIKVDSYFNAGDLGDNIVVNKEDDVMVIVPIGFEKSWLRFNNILDSYEYEANNPEGRLDSELKILETTLYPYVNLMKRTDNGMEIFWIPIWKDLLDRGELEKDFIPYVPFDIFLLLEYLDIKNAFDVYFQLRPMLYTFWS